MKKKTFWLSYDLGVAGDYANLYQWLDDHKAVSCGNSIAYFKYDVPSEDNSFVDLKKDLEGKVNLKPGNVLYVISRSDEEPHKTIGKFLYGKRKASPWEGYGAGTSNEVDG